MKRLDLAKKALSKAALAEALGHLVAAFIERPLPELAALNLDFSPTLLASGWVARVPALTIHTHNPPAAATLDALAARESLVFEVSNVGTLRFSRGPDGALSTLHLVTTPERHRTAAAHLTSLAGRVRTFTSEGVSAAIHRTLQATLEAAAPTASAHARRKVRALGGTLKALAWSAASDALLCSDGHGLVVKRA